MSNSIAHFGKTQQTLLKHLLRTREGLSADELADRLSISKNAARQHILTLERDGYIEKGNTRPTGRRPEQLYALTRAGEELFPRNYSFMADRLVAEVAKDGGNALSRLMRRMGKSTAQTIRKKHSSNNSSPSDVTINLVSIMDEIGYETESGVRSDEVIAYNCIFHHLAENYPEICEFDLAFIETVTGRSVEHRECMVRGGECCRFRLKDK